jgi:hypothetical protein
MNPPPYSQCVGTTKYFPSAYIWQHCVCANTTTTAYINGPPPEVGDLCWLWDSVHNQVLRAYAWGSSYSSVHWLCLRWRPFPSIMGSEASLRMLRNWMECNWGAILRPTHQWIWTGSSEDNTFAKYCKWAARFLHWPQKSDNLAYTCSKCTGESLGTPEGYQLYCLP